MELSPTGKRGKTKSGTKTLKPGGSYARLQEEWIRR